MMNNASLVLALFLLQTLMLCIDTHLPCVTRDGPQVSAQYGISSVSCLSNETMVSCGIQGIENPGGTWIQNGICDALHLGTDTRGVQAKSRCCAFPSNTNITITTVSSTDGTFVTATCPPDTVLVGCQVYWVSGGYTQLRGAFSGPSTTTPQTTAWISTDNQCNAKCLTGATVKAGAICASVNDAYTLNCETNAVYVGSSGNPGSLPCASGYSMTGCSPLTTSDTKTIDHWYITDDDLCYCSQDAFATMYRSAICCGLDVITADPSHPTNTPSESPLREYQTSQNPSPSPTFAQTVIPSIAPTLIPSNDPTFTPTYDPSSSATYIDHDTVIHEKIEPLQVIIIVGSIIISLCFCGVTAFYFYIKSMEKAHRKNMESISVNKDTNEGKQPAGSSQLVSAFCSDAEGNQVSTIQGSDIVNVASRTRGSQSNNDNVILQDNEFIVVGYDEEANTKGFTK